MQLKKRATTSRIRGDTLVEVLFATATAGLLIVITLVLMNRNLAQIQMSVETTFVRQAIDSQAEVLRYMRDQYMNDRSAELNASNKPTPSKLWKDLVDSSRPANHVQSAATNFGTCQPDATGTVNPPASGKAFFINNSTSGNAEGDAADIQALDATNADNLLNSTLAQSDTYARPGHGLWVEAVSPVFTSSQTDRYVDFHIRACWDPPFSAAKATLGTIVRLYYVIPGAPLPPAFLSLCSNGVDDDGDGAADFPADPGCSSGSDNSETNAPLPPPPPPPPPFSWQVNGSDFATCTPPGPGDGHDGCFTNEAPATYAWRNFTATYNTSGIRSGLATIEIEYSQYADPLPSGYPAYDVTVTPSGSSPTTYSLPTGPPGVLKTYTSTINIGVDNPATLSLAWTNNIGNGGGDANLKIHRITVRRP
jgi:hypothetical protein